MLTALFQLLQCVGACRFEQPVRGLGRFEIDDQERFGGEICDAFQLIGATTVNEDTGSPSLSSRRACTPAP
jgi:hypothetical protein